MVPKIYNDVSAGDLDAGLAYTTKLLLAYTTKLLIQGLGKNALRMHISYIAEDGLRVLDDKGKYDLWSPVVPIPPGRTNAPEPSPSRLFTDLRPRLWGFLKQC